MHNVQLGLPEEPPGEPFDIFAVLAGAVAAKALTPDMLENGLIMLPTGLRTFDEHQVLRGADRRVCD